MRYDVTRKLFDHRGRSLPLDPQHPDQQATLRDILEMLCMSHGDNAKTADEKLKVYRTLQRVMAANPTVTLSVEEVALFKKIAGDAYPAPMVGLLFDILEPPNQPTEAAVEAPVAAK